MAELMGILERASNALERFLGPSPALSFLLLSALLFVTAAVLTRTDARRMKRAHKGMSHQRAEDGRI